MENEIDAFQSVEHFNKYISVVDVSASHIEGRIKANGDKPIRMKATIFLLVERGTIRISIDYKMYNVEANSLVIVIPSHIMQLIEVSKDFKGKRMLLSNTFMDDIHRQNPNRTNSIEGYMQVRKHPVEQLQSRHVPTLSASLDNLQERILQKDHTFYGEMINNAFLSFVLEMGHALSIIKERSPRTKLSRKDELFEQFLELLFIHSKREHNSAFYAESMCITPQYLSLILKETSGKSANTWINEALLTEAKILLKSPDYTIQQIADMLHFADQSSFGKFFKRHTGMSPLSYRKR